MVIRVPTMEEFLAYDGAHTKLLWQRMGPDWRCPSCRRNKYEILRWTTRFPKSAAPYMGWVAPLHGHHDHGSDSPGSGIRSRFPETIICDQCNSADGAAKRKLKLPSNFSFSPMEIGRFVKPQPHGPHTIDYQLAQALYEAIRLSSMEPPPPPNFWA